MKVEVDVLGSRPYGFCVRKATLHLFFFVKVRQYKRETVHMSHIYQNQVFDNPTALC